MVSSQQGNACPMPQAALDRYCAKSGKTPSCELANSGQRKTRKQHGQAGGNLHEAKQMLQQLLANAATACAWCSERLQFWAVAAVIPAAMVWTRHAQLRDGRPHPEVLVSSPP